jgi:serine/threonine-protein kinase
MTFTIGETVGPYQIIEQLGSGGMATVYKAYHAALDRYVAIKVLHPAFKQDANFLARFQREARIVAKLEHPHIVPVYDFNEHGGQPYLVMRFIDGETLKARLGEGDLPFSEILRILRPAGEGLAYAHAQGVLHRDVKPSNILLTPDGGVFLADFGLARIAQAGESTLSQDSLLGTPQYISPEQAQGRSDIDARTDVYSLGVVMYELLVGRVPYQADTPYAVIHDHIYTPLPLPRSIKPALSENLERVLLKALAKERDDRFSGVTELMTAFDQAMQAAPTEIAPVRSAPIGLQPVAPTVAALPASTVASPPAAAPDRSKLWIALGAAALLVAVIVIIILVTARPPLPPVQPNQPPLGNPPPQNTGAQAQVDQLLQQFNQANQQALKGDVKGARDSFNTLAKSAHDLAAAPGLLPEQQTQLHTLAGESWLAGGQANLAQPEFETLARENPNRPDPLIGLAAADLIQNNLPEAERVLNRALEIDPQFALAHALRACLLLKQNEPVRATREYRLATAAAGDAKTFLPPWVRLVLADLDCREDRFK